MAEADIRDSTARLGAIARRLQELTGRLEEQHDSRCVFTYAYAIMTWKIANDLRNRPDVDSRWVTSLAEAFSERYFQAVDEYDRGTLDSDAWRSVFDALRNRRTSVLEDMVLPITGHIVHDLPLALIEVSPTDGPELARIHDFHAVNDIMHDAVELMEEEVSHRYGGGLDWIDQMAETYDEILTSYGIRMSRGLGWYNALRLADPKEHAEARAAIEKSPMIVVENVLDPPVWSLGLVARLMRLASRQLRRWPDTDPSAGIAQAVARVIAKTATRSSRAATP
jgi:Family of unknown function (DUF5995)